MIHIEIELDKIDNQKLADSIRAALSGSKSESKKLNPLIPALIKTPLVSELSVKLAVNTFLQSGIKKTADGYGFKISKLSAK